MSEVVAVQQMGGSSGLIDLDYGSAADLRKKLDGMKLKLDLTREFFREVMKEGIDYGVIPGTEKKTLYKAGAEALCEFYNFAPTLAGKSEEKDMVTGYYGVDITIRLIHRSTGTVIGEGVGHANTYESRYRWRWVPESEIPRGYNKDDLYSKNFAKRGNNPWYKYRLENDDMYSIWNTVLKMAKKRALVDATLQATRSSGIFAQTEEELEAFLHGDDPEKEPEERPRPQPPKSHSNQRSGNTGGAQRQSGAIGDKNRALELVKQQRGGADWPWLADRAGEALGRNIQRVIQEVNDTEWKAVADYLEQYQEGDGQGSFPWEREGNQ